MKILLTENQFKILTEKLIIEATDQWKMNPMDYYEVLGVDKTANKDAIKKAYRKLALKYHPDSNQGNKEAEDIFKNASEAYNTLSNDTIKNKYDEWHEKVWPLIKQQKETQAQNQNKEKERQERERQEQERQEQERVAREKQEKEKNRGKSLPVPSSNSNTNKTTSIGKANQTNNGGSTGGSNNSNKTNTGNNNNTSSGGGGSGSSTGNTNRGVGKKRKPSGKGNTSTTSTEDKNEILASDEILKKAYYQAPNIFDMFFNILRGRNVFDGKGRVKIEDIISKLKSNIGKFKALLPNIYKNFTGDNQPIQFTLVEPQFVNFGSTLELDGSQKYNLNINKTYQFDNNNNLNTNFTINNYKGTIKIIGEVNDGIDDIVEATGTLRVETNVNGVKKEDVLESTPKNFKIKLISKSGTGYFKK